MHALDLPEITSLIASFLTKADLAVSIRICKAWNASLLPILWSDLTLSNRATHGPIAMSTHAHLIKKLVLFFYIPPVGEPVVVSNLSALTTLQVSMDGDRPREGAEVQTQLCEDLVRSSPLLCNLYIDFNTNTNDIAPLLRVIKSRSYLRDLSLRRVAFNETTMDIFLDVCQGLDKLTLDQATFATDSLLRESTRLGTTSIPRLSSLSLSLVQFPHDNLPDLLALFTGLQCLHLVTGHQQGETHLAIVRLAGTRQWPLLHSLSVFCYSGNISDQDLAAVLEAMSTCKMLNFQTNKVGPRVMELLLHRHSLTLESLRLRGIEDKERGKDWIPELMEKCPNLKELEVDWLDVGRVVSGLPWQCLGLTSFRATLLLKESEPFMETREALFDRLGQLDKLRELDFNAFHTQDGYKDLMDLRLGKGLEKLSGWTLLENVSFLDSIQDWSMGDLEWMVGHWKSLLCIRGNVSQDPEVQEVMAEYLRGRGVEFYPDDKYY